MRSLDLGRSLGCAPAGLIAGRGLGRGAALTGGSVLGSSLDGAVRALLTTTLPGVLHTDLAACSAYRGRADAARDVTCPTLVLVGAEDRMAPPKRGRERGGTTAGAVVETVPRAGHMLMPEAADAITKALMGFLVPPRR